MKKLVLMGIVGASVACMPLAFGGDARDHHFVKDSVDHHQSENQAPRQAHVDARPREGGYRRGWRCMAERHRAEPRRQGCRGNDREKHGRSDGRQGQHRGHAARLAVNARSRSSRTGHRGMRYRGVFLCARSIYRGTRVVAAAKRSVGCGECSPPLFTRVHPTEFDRVPGLRCSKFSCAFPRGSVRLFHEHQAAG